MALRSRSSRRPAKPDRLRSRLEPTVTLGAAILAALASNRSLLNCSLRAIHGPPLTKLPPTGKPGSAPLPTRPNRAHGAGILAALAFELVAPGHPWPCAHEAPANRQTRIGSAADSTPPPLPARPSW